MLSRARTVPLALSLLLSLLTALLLPTGTAWAAPAETADTEACAVLPLTGFGSAEQAHPVPVLQPGATACFTVTTDTPGLHRIIVGDTAFGLRTEVLDGGTAVQCVDATHGLSAMSCRLPHSGTYTLKLLNPVWEEPAEGYVAVVPLATMEGCLPAAGTAWDLPPVTGVVAHRSQVVCRPFDARPGERVRVQSTGLTGGVEWITDETGALLCDLSQACLLPGDGPYRLLAHPERTGPQFLPATYETTVRRYSDPVPCATVPVGPYGSAPAPQQSSAPCKTFTVPADGTYYVLPGTTSSSGTVVYDRAGVLRCSWTDRCALTAPGPYTVFTDRPTLVLDATSTEGCAQGVAGVNSGSLAELGERDCFVLPFPAGARIAAVADKVAPFPDAIRVVDATGADVCREDTAEAGTCTLSGQAPFRLLVDAPMSVWDPPYAARPYTVRVYRTDGPGSCPVLPAGDFTPTGASVRLDTGEQTSFCLSIPAADHSAAEILHVDQISGGSSSLSSTVFDERGQKVCELRRRHDAWQACSLAPGTAYTVLAVGASGAGEFRVSRKDVTATARGCDVTPATAVGSPAYTGTLPPPGTLLCRRVTTEAPGDTLFLGLRDGGDNASKAAFRSDGRQACGLSRSGCSVRGATSYQTLIEVTGYATTPPSSYRFEAQRVATAAGAAPECVKAADIAYGYGPVTGVLDERRTAVCVALPTYAKDSLRTKVVETEGGFYPPVPLLIALGQGGVVCQGPNEDTCTVFGTEGTAQPTVLFLGLPEKASYSAFSAEAGCTLTVCGGASVSFGTVTPPFGGSGTKARVTLTGTALKAGHTLRIGYPSGTTAESTTVSVAADRRSLVAEFDLTGAPVGAWPLSAVDGEQTTPLGTFTVVKASAVGLGSFKALGSTRLMDTRSGLGVRQGKVGPDGTVTLQVAGAGRVPATGVSAVVLNVTVTAPTAGGFVSVHPAGTARTAASNLNFKAGQTISNLVVVPVVNGKVSFYNRAGSTDLLADVAGYYVTDGTGGTYEPVTPTRLMDTRSGLGVRKGKVGPGHGGMVLLQVTGRGGVPATGVSAVVLNVTATAGTSGSFVSVLPRGSLPDSTSNLNFSAGQTLPNLVVTKVGADGKVVFYNHLGSVDLLADVAGYYTTGPSGSAYHPMTPNRLMDTRSGLGAPKAKVGAGRTVTLQVAGTHGIPATGVTAVVVNVTAVAPTAAGFVSVFPDGTARTSASNLNFTAGTTIPNLVVVPVVNGKVSFYNHAGSVDLLADVAGYYVS
ncbi:hypothetical protein [Streptomyces sp. NPDC093111]|uniref:hypothetical protein n=1 Tax=Streptomyces sp. NPDC093111 TaxID=3154978 RepID=UPI003413909D